ncbi:subtilisin-like serine protease [Tulasnella sp. JGI-2019a]|nr:subtilisin-like serine protease [Tulasnella sp. JGI-2019a]
MNWIYNKAGAGRDRSVINASGGGPEFRPLDELFTNMDAAGFYVVVSAGQEAKGIDASSVTGSPAWSNFGAVVDFWAPGEGACQITGLKLSPSGTSPAAALVSGIIALYLGENKNIGKPDLLEKMKANSDPLAANVNWPNGGRVPLVPGTRSGE